MSEDEEINARKAARQRLFTRHFRGKTIASVEAKSVNYLVFLFTDGTKAELEVEAVGGGLYGIELCRK